MTNIRPPEPIDTACTDPNRRHELRFAFMAVTVAQRAKCGGASLRDRLNLTIECLGDTDRAAVFGPMVQDFHRDVETDPRGAGERLLEATMNWVAATGTPEVATQVSDYDWQRRADLA